MKPELILHADVLDILLKTAIKNTALMNYAGIMITA